MDARLRNGVGRIVLVIAAMLAMRCGAEVIDPGKVVVGAEMLVELREQLLRHEGYRLHVYPDGIGHLTIGVGFSLHRGDARDRLAAIGRDYDAVREGICDLSDDDIQGLLSEDILAAIADANAVVPNYAALPRRAQLVFANMAFNLGRSGLGGFTKMLQAVRREDWPVVAEEMIASRWHGQVKGRALELEEIIAGLGKER